MTTRIIVCGGRNFNDKNLFEETLDRIIPLYDSPELISGHASGADMLAEEYAQKNNLRITVFKPDWKKYGRAAGPIRNREMIQFAAEEQPVIIAFWNGSSRGTKNMIEQGEKAGAKIHVIAYQEL